MDNIEAQLIIEKANIVFRYLLSIGVEYQIAEDIVGEAIYKSILYFDGIEPENLKSWLFRVALNGYYDLLKKNKRQTLYGTVDLDRFSQYLLKEQSESLEKKLIQSENHKLIAETIRSLNKSMQEVLLLRVQMELSYKEIGEYLDMPIETVRTYLYRARLELKNRWEKEDGKSYEKRV
ncbi:RNA polymerase sigma factor [Clostridia bacterium]|nr:RNA polymerase sigma factor [Clostridia bacterium]